MLSAVETVKYIQRILPQLAANMARALPVVITVGFEKRDIIRIRRAVMKLERRVPYFLDRMQWQCATEFVQLLKRNITNQFFAPYYKKYSPDYLKWKRMVSPGGFHVLMGDFYRNLSVFRERAIKPGRTKASQWMGGIHYTAMDRGGKNWSRKGRAKPIAMYIRVMEKGSKGTRAVGDHPQREIFRPTTMQYIASGDWRRRADELLEVAGKAWS